MKKEWRACWRWSGAGTDGLHPDGAAAERRRCGSDRTPTVPAEPDAGYNTGAGEVVQIKGFRSIDIEWVSGAVNVELYDGEGIQLSETMMDGGDVALKMEWRVDEDDNTLDIRSQPLTVSASQKKQLTVRLPRSTVLHELNIDAVSADVSVDLTEEDTLTLTELDVSQRQRHGQRPRRQRRGDLSGDHQRRHHRQHPHR